MYLGVRYLSRDALADRNYKKKLNSDYQISLRQYTWSKIFDSGFSSTTRQIGFMALLIH